jgi:hypothetical protein
MPEQPTLRTEEDLQRVIRALAREFKTDTVFVIGSQAILMSWPDPPSVMLMTPEIDAYPANAGCGKSRSKSEMTESRARPPSTSTDSSEKALPSIAHTAFISTAPTRVRPSFPKAGTPEP